MTLAVLGLTALAAVAQSPAAEGDLALLPASGFLGTWERTGAARVFAGTQLYEHIDGGAEIFYELGFMRVTTATYRAGDDELGVELYRLADPAAALGIYLSRCGREAPAAGLAERHTAGRHQLLLVRERFFLVVDNLTGAPQTARDLVAFAREIAARLPADPGVDLLDLLPRPGRVPGSERLVRGPLGLEAFIVLGEGDVLQLGGRVTAVAARYEATGEEGARSLLLAPYPDQQTAARAFRHLASHLDPGLRVLAREDSRLVLQDYSQRFALVSLCGPRIELTFGLEISPLTRAGPACSPAADMGTPGH